MLRKNNAQTVNYNKLLLLMRQELTFDKKRKNLSVKNKHLNENKIILFYLSSKLLVNVIKVSRPSLLRGGTGTKLMKWLSKNLTSLYLLYQSHRYVYAVG